MQRGGISFSRTSAATSSSGLPSRGGRPCASALDRGQAIGNFSPCSFAQAFAIS